MPGQLAEFKADTAMTGMVLLCYLGAGHTHQQDGPYQGAVNKGLHWLIQRQAADGDLRQGETMYGQTVASVALCEAFAMTKDPALAEPARKAVEFVLNRAATAHPASDRDTSVLGWLVFTVDSARRAGFTVPQATFDAARRWLTTVSTPASPGAYAYTRGGAASPAMTAEGDVRPATPRPHTRRSPHEAVRPLRPGLAPQVAGRRSNLLLVLRHPRPLPAPGRHLESNGKTTSSSPNCSPINNKPAIAPPGSWDTTDPWSRMGRARVYQTAVCTLSPRGLLPLQGRSN